MFATEFLDLPALQAASGTVVLPGSKSISNRVLLLAMLSSGQTRIHDLLDSDDTRVMLDAMRTLGCVVDRDADGAHRVTGLGAKVGAPLPVRQAKLFLGNAGTAMRPLVAALSVLGGDFELRGVPRMHERPIGDLVDALRAIGCVIEDLGQAGYPPLRIGEGQLRLNAPLRVRGDVSSQFLTALLLALPLAARTDISIEVEGELISKPYIDLTLKLLARFGVEIVAHGYERFVIPAGSQYQSPGEIWVEGDASSASYFVALGALSPPTSLGSGAHDAAQSASLSVQGVGSASIQGDVRFAEACVLMGARIDMQPNAVRVARGAWPLKGIDLDCNHIPDAAMTLAVMALYADGPTTLRNIASWRVKETDRLSAMATELRKLGARVEEGPDSLRVYPIASGQWRAASIRTYDDHRMAMCFSLAAFNPDGVPVRIQDPKCVGKTFPDYFETLFSVCKTPAARIPVICIDGPTASGKGTLASRLAQHLGYGYLDSGALYRALGVAAQQTGVSLDDEAALASLAARLPVHFVADRIELDGADVTDAVRSEAGGMAASRVSAWPAVRQALVARQLAFRKLPGLVTDGRDMGTVIFPDAPLKVYLTASAARRAERRHKQLISKGFSATLSAIRADLEARDARDSSRSVAPLKPADDALLLDNSGLSIDESIALVLAWWQRKQGF